MAMYSSGKSTFNILPALNYGLKIGENFTLTMTAFYKSNKISGFSDVRYSHFFNKNNALFLNYNLEENDLNESSVELGYKLNF